MMKKFKNLLLVALFFITATIIAQTKVSGTVVDETGEPLPGASVVEKGTTNGTATDFDGKFSLDAKSNSGSLVVSFVGFAKKTISFANGGNIGKIQLTPDSNSLEEVVITASGVIDLAEDRKTPIAVSSIKASEIQEKAGNWDLPEVLKSTPSVQNVKRGAFGEGQMFLRGFDQTNTAFMLNGQPINGVEDGKMYWSNWSGVLDVANAIQVQRGLGSSKLAISSVGGTVNIVAKTIDKKRGGFIQQMIGNDLYTKTTAYYTTGLMESGWSVGAMLGYWEGDGYVDRTRGQGQTYYLSIGYKPNENNVFNFLLTGAPQWHAVAGRGTIKDFLDNGIKYNSWNDDAPKGTPYLIDGKYPGGRNIYHKPVANLTWDYTLAENTSLSSVLYGSLGRGSFSTEKINNGVGYVRGSYNNHNWFGLLTNLSTKLNDNLDFNIGLDGRMYNGIHFSAVNQFIGGQKSLDQESIFSGKYTITETYGGINPWGMLFNPNDDHKQRFRYDYEEDISYYGLFTQLEYANDSFSAFFQGSVSNQHHVKKDYYNYTTAKESESISNLGYNVKGGFSYAINEGNRLFANAGFYSRQPFHDDIFDQIRKSNDLLEPAVPNQEILGLEIGYQFKSDFFDFNLNGYRTAWDKRTLLSDNGENREDVKYESYQTLGVSQLHQGVELEVFSRPFDILKLNGFASIGDWSFNGNGTQKAFNGEGQQKDGSEEVKLDGKKVGGAAQTTAGVSAVLTILPKLTFDANWNFYANLYSNGSLTKDPLKLPSYHTTDLGLTYKLKTNTKDITGVDFRVSVGNATNEKYLESVYGNTKASLNPSENWKGVNTSNNGRFGYGRTWNASVRFKF